MTKELAKTLFSQVGSLINEYVPKLYKFEFFNLLDIIIISDDESITDISLFRNVRVIDALSISSRKECTSLRVLKVKELHTATQKEDENNILKYIPNIQILEVWGENQELNIHSLPHLVSLNISSPISIKNLLTLNLSELTARYIKDENNEGANSLEIERLTVHEYTETISMISSLLYLDIYYGSDEDDPDDMSLISQLSNLETLIIHEYAGSIIFLGSLNRLNHFSRNFDIK